jgi:pilus assembly protein Flp/PilA
MKAFLERLVRDTRGTSAVEMGLICALIVLAMLTALQGVANQTKATWNNVSSKSGEAIAGATAA